MAGRGQAPKETRQRDRDNKRTTISWDGSSFWGEDLPEDVPFSTKGQPDGVLIWHPMTRQWWDAWRKWPALKDAHPVMWNFLLATALMVNQMWNNGRWDFAGEIRLREGKFGATPADLRSLGYDYELEGQDDEDDEDTKKPGTVTDLESRRERMLEAVPDAVPAAKKVAAPRKRAPSKTAVKRAVAQKKAPTKAAAAKKTAPARKRAAVRPDAGDPAPY